MLAQPRVRAVSSGPLPALAAAALTAVAAAASVAVEEPGYAPLFAGLTIGAVAVAVAWREGGALATLASSAALVWAGAAAWGLAVLGYFAQVCACSYPAPASGVPAGPQLPLDLVQGVAFFGGGALAFAGAALRRRSATQRS